MCIRDSTTVANTLRGRSSRLPVIAMIQYTTASAMNSMPAMPTKDNGAMSTPWNKLIAVSYTHLDVYKRQEYARWLAGGLYAVYSVAIMLMMIQCAQASRDRGINPVFIYGFFGGIVYALHDVGFIGGTFAEQTMIIGIAPLAVVALVAVYLLGLMYFIGQGGFRRIFKHDSDAAASIELVALRAVSYTHLMPSSEAFVRRARPS